MIGGNDARVTHGVLAGAIAAIGWWALGAFAGIVAPAEVVASSVVILTALVQWFMPTGG